MEQIKIRLFGIHLCYINSEILRIFQDKFSILNLNSWIKEEVYSDYGIYLKDEYDIEEFKELLREDYYDNVGEWLKEKIRNKLKNHNKLSL